MTDDIIPAPIEAEDNNSHEKSEAALTQERARAKIDNIGLDKDFLSALTEPSHPGHRVAVAQRRQLYEAAYPTRDPATALGESEGNAQGQTEAAAVLLPPKDPNDYTFEKTPATLEHDAELEYAARGWFHEGGLPQPIAKNVVHLWNQRVAQPPSAAEIDAEGYATEERLQKEWGADYDRNMKIANDTVKQAGAEATEALHASGLCNSYYLIKSLVGLAEGRGDR